MSVFVILLQLSFGIGYDIEDDNSPERRDIKGIFQIEQTQGNFSYGFWHSSQLDNGFKGDVEDQNILYIKKDFSF